VRFIVRRKYYMYCCIFLCAISWVQFLLLSNRTPHPPLHELVGPRHMSYRELWYTPNYEGPVSGAYIEDIILNFCVWFAGKKINDF
jgi:hypothetical protein